jgi:peptidoglycan/LPS O-acetylase OafA/YrhL
MTRLACALVLIAMALLIWMVLAPTGWSAIWFSFVGTPLLGLAVGMLILAIRSEVRRPAKSGRPSDSGRQDL